MILDKELDSLREELAQAANIFEIARREYDIRDADSYSKDELIEKCIGTEYRTYWV